jgi:hypothetical protein
MDGNPGPDTSPCSPWRRMPGVPLRRQWPKGWKSTMGMGANYDQSAGITALLHRHNLATAYGVNLVGNTYTGAVGSKAQSRQSPKAADRFRDSTRCGASFLDVVAHVNDLTGQLDGLKPAPASQLRGAIASSYLLRSSDLLLSVWISWHTLGRQRRSLIVPDVICRSELLVGTSGCNAWHSIDQ